MRADSGCSGRVAVVRVGWVALARGVFFSVLNNIEYSKYHSYLNPCSCQVLFFLSSITTRTPTLQRFELFLYFLLKKKLKILSVTLAPQIPNICSLSGAGWKPPHSRICKPLGTQSFSEVRSLPTRETDIEVAHTSMKQNLNYVVGNQLVNSTRDLGNPPL